MTHSLAFSAHASWLQSKSTGVKIAAVVLGTLLLSASSYISVPTTPVPMTMQTLAVTLIGAAYGWRLGGLTVVIWLAEAVIGLPVLANGAGGIAPFLGATAGYLFAFPLAAAVTGWLVSRGWNGQRALFAFAAMLIGNAICLLVGGAWLGMLVGAHKAIALGVAPFVAGAVLKSVLGAALLKATSAANAASIRR